MDVNDSQWKATHHKLASITVKNSAIEQEVLDITAIDEEADIVTICSLTQQRHKPVISKSKSEF